MVYTLQQLREMKRNYERLKDAQQRITQKLNDEIARLQAVCNYLENLEDGEINTLVKDTKQKKVADGFEWRGQSKDEFDSNIKDSVEKAAKDFRSSVDAMTDKLNWEIQIRKSQRDAANGKIFSYNNSLGWIVTAIKNLVD